MTEYRIRATNYLAMDLHFGLYQKQAAGHETMVWKVLSLSKPQPTPTRAVIPWTLSYELTIPQKQTSGDSYVGGLSLVVKPGYNYELYLNEKNFYQIREIYAGSPNVIGFRNNTKVAENMGLMVSGTLTSMQKNVAAGEMARFNVTPAYYCGLYAKVTQGEVASTVTPLKTSKISFPTGLTTASVSAYIDEDGQIRFGEIIYSA